MSQKNDEHSRREILTKGLTLGALTLGSLSFVQFLPASLQSNETQKSKKVRYGMVIDLKKCIGCNACVIACKQENNIPIGNYRTWVKDVERGNYPQVKRGFIPVLCNHCEDPICNRNCPVKATYQRPDGIVLVDYDRCIGCKYCMVSCPYNMRFPHPYRRTADKCTFCVHRLDRGLKPACVDACIGKSRIFGNLLDPASEVSRLIASQPVHVLKPEQNTKPQVYFLNLDYIMVEANKTDFKYMECYRRNVPAEMGITEKQAEENYTVLKDKCGADRVYDSTVQANTKRVGAV
jgi:tetrathionate reductase subunit B